MHHPRRSIRNLLALGLALVAGISAAARPAQAQLKYELPDFEVEVALLGAVFYPEQVNEPRKPALLIEASRFGDRWDRVWGVARNFNVAIHSGRVESATVTDTAVDLQVAMKIEGDAWKAGGRGDYTITLARAIDGTLKGTYTGTFAGNPCKGEAFGRVRPKAEPIPGYQPLQSGEHPRILFRKSDLPAIKERLNTPMGKVAFDAISDSGPNNLPNAIGYGVKYQLTGDKKYAELAQKACAAHMADTSVPAFARGRQWGARIEQVAISFDLCYDAWPVDFRKEVASYLVYIGNSAFFDQRKLGQSINWMVGSNYAGPIFAGVGFAGLALWGEQGPEPAKPGEPKAVNTLPAAKDFKPADGVPVVPITLGKSPRKWLTTEGLTFAMSNDPMVAIGEIDTTNIKPGDKVQVDHAEATFTVLPEKLVGPNGGILLKGGLKTGKTVSLLGYTVLDVPEPMRVKVRAPFSKSGRVQVVLNGVRVSNDQVIDLEKGYYQMFVALRLGAEWGTLEPWFEAATEADVEKSKSLLGEQQVEYIAALKDWEYDQKEWKRLGGADLNFLKLHEMGRRMMYLFCREAATDGGYQTESGHYWEDGIDGPDRYMIGYRNAFGRDVSTFPDINNYVPRMVFSHLYLSGGKSQWFNISSSIGNNFNRQLSLFPTLPEKYKPVVLWHINRELGGSPDKPDLAKIARANPIYTLLYYPTDMKPAEPATVMPLTWSAPAYGFYAFRNGWKGDDDILAAFLGRSHGSHGWGGPDGGAFRLLGFGQSWGGGGNDREVRRWSESVIVLNDPTVPRFGSIGEITFAEQKPDGSGIVSYDYSKSCYPPAEKGKPNPAPALSAYGGIWHEATQPPPVTAFRAIAVDYSGKSGSPCLVAIVDRVDGGGEKEWLWHTDLKDVTKTANGFLITKKAGTFNGVFAAPAKPVIDISAESRKTTKSAGHNAGSEISMNVAAVQVESPDPKEGHFFFVGTLQKGPAPEIKVEGTGLNAVVTVGGQTVRFDGKKIILGEK